MFACLLFCHCPALNIGSVYDIVTTLPLFPLSIASFSPDGWSTTIKDVSCDFVDRDKSGTFMVGFAAIVRVTTKNGKIVMHGVHGGVFL